MYEGGGEGGVTSFSVVELNFGTCKYRIQDLIIYRVMNCDLVC